MDDALALRPTLAAWLAEYDEIENDYIQRLRALGIEFAKPHTCDAQVARLRAELASGGARVRNAGASICSARFRVRALLVRATAVLKRSFFRSLATVRAISVLTRTRQEASVFAA